MSEVSPIELQEYLKGLEYPADKDQVTEHAKKKGADQQVLDLIGRLPDKEFASPIEVSKAVGTFG